MFSVEKLSGINFNPRSPCGERQQPGTGHHDESDFNPRSPCGERLCVLLLFSHTIRYFNPRSPCGERLGMQAQTDNQKLFQSTLPMRGATPPQSLRSPLIGISIHAPHAGSDRIAAYSMQRVIWHFNPRSPCGERRLKDAKRVVNLSNFNPRSPCGERRY